MVDLLGQLIPIGGGDPIPLTVPRLTVGRRESCDLCLRHSNVSSVHCELSFRNGRWSVRDLGSSNGTKVNGIRMKEKTLHPGDEVGIAGHRFTIEYQLPAGIVFEDSEGAGENVFGQSLMERAGLSKPKPAE